MEDWYNEVRKKQFMKSLLPEPEPEIQVQQDQIIDPYTEVPSFYEEEGAVFWGETCFSRYTDLL